MNSLSVSHLASPRVTLDITNHLDRAFVWKIVKQRAWPSLAIARVSGYSALDRSAFCPLLNSSVNVATHHIIIIKASPTLL